MRRLTAAPGWPLLWLVLAAAVPFLNSLTNGFALDDVFIIQLNERVHSLSDPAAIWLTPYWPFMGTELGLWRPLMIFSYAVQWALSGGRPWVFHAVSILLHVLATGLVFLLLRRLTSTAAGFAGALLFAVHPVHTEAVANVVGQAELVTACALLAACVVHAHRPPGVNVPWKHASLLLVLFACGLLAKENAVVLPGLLVATDLAQRRLRLTAAGLSDYARALAPAMLLLATALAGYLAVRFTVLEGSLTGIDPDPQLHFLREEFRVLNALRAFPEFIRLIVFPLELSADYSPGIVLPVESVTLMVAVGALLLTILLLLALLTPLQPALGFAAAWFLISVVTVSNLLFPIGVLIAERTLYLPSMAVSAALAFAVVTLARRTGPHRRRIAAAALAAVVVAFGIRTWIRNPDWATTHDVLYSVLRDHPESYRAQWTHAGWQMQIGNVDAARYHYELAYRIYDRDSQFLTEFGGFLLEVRDTTRAISVLEQAYALHPHIDRTIVVLASAYLGVGRYTDALDLARRTESMGMHPRTSLPIRAAALYGLGESEQAAAAWRLMVRDTATILPPYAWMLIARRLADTGLQPDARHALQRARNAARGNAALLENIRALESDLGLHCDRGASRAETESEPVHCEPDPAPPPDNPAQNATVSQNARTGRAPPSPISFRAVAQAPLLQRVATCAPQKERALP
jgi:protein O-mannosyl-transferase